MEKYLTIAALLTAGAAFANAEDITFASDGWVIGHNRGNTDRPTYVIDAENNSMSLTNSNWSQALAYYELEAEVLSFSLDMTIKNMTGSFTVSLIGDNYSFVFGKNYDASTYEFAMTTNVDSDVTKALMFKQADATNRTAYVQGTNTGVNAAVDMVLNIAGVVDANNKLTLTLDGVTVGSVDLGASRFDLDVIGFYGDGANSTPNVEFSNLKVSVLAIPEPSAFGLLAGLGALALVGTRRRRR